MRAEPTSKQLKSGVRKELHYHFSFEGHLIQWFHNGMQFLVRCDKEVFHFKKYPQSLAMFRACKANFDSRIKIEKYANKAHNITNAGI